MTDPLFPRFGREFRAGEVLFREGESGEEMFVIQSGIVRISKHSFRICRQTDGANPLPMLQRMWKVGNGVLTGQHRALRLIEDLRRCGTQKHASKTSGVSGHHD